VKTVDDMYVEGFGDCSMFEIDGSELDSWPSWALIFFFGGMVLA